MKNQGKPEDGLPLHRTRRDGPGVTDPSTSLLVRAMRGIGAVVRIGAESVPRSCAHLYKSDAHVGKGQEHV